MRTGSEYREALHDGRRVWVIGEGLIEDVTVHVTLLGAPHPATVERLRASGTTVDVLPQVSGFER